MSRQLNHAERFFDPNPGISTLMILKFHFISIGIPGIKNFALVFPFKHLPLLALHDKYIYGIM